MCVPVFVLIFMWVRACISYVCVYKHTKRNRRCLFTLQLNHSVTIHNCYFQTVSHCVKHDCLNLPRECRFLDSNIIQSTCGSVFHLSFQISHLKRARDTREMSHIHISCSCRIPSDGVTWISRWCHMDLFWIKWNARQLSYGVMWSHVRPIADSSRSEHNWKSKTALLFESIGRSFWG